MKDNFDIYAWNRNNLLENNLEDADLKAKQRVDTLCNQITKEFPDKFESSIEKSQLKYIIASAFTDLALNEDGVANKKYVVQYWIYKNDDYDDEEIEVEASSEEEALKIAKLKAYKGKNFKIVGDLNETSKNPIKETLKFIMENPEGYSKYFPGGKTKGLDKDTLSTILMQIIKDTEEEGMGLNESTLCKRGQDYIKSRKSAGEKSSAYLSGRAVKVCKGNIKFKGKKQTDFKG